MSATAAALPLLISTTQWPCVLHLLRTACGMLQQQQLRSAAETCALCVHSLSAHTTQHADAM